MKAIANVAKLLTAYSIFKVHPYKSHSPSLLHCPIVVHALFSPYFAILTIRESLALRYGLSKDGLCKLAKKLKTFEKLTPFDIQSIEPHFSRLLNGLYAVFKVPSD